MEMNLASYIDHTLLKPEASEVDIKQLVQEAIDNQFASVCVNPYWVSYCANRLAETDVNVCTVIGFPLGATPTATKVFETKLAIENGAREIDMVINIGALKSGDDAAVLADIIAVAHAAKGSALTKVIIETALLTDEEKIKACQLAKQADVDFVKTSTGFSGGGATVADLTLMRETVGPNMGIKASGGVRDLETMETMIAAGATRIGASAGVEIIQGNKADTSY